MLTARAENFVNGRHDLDDTIRRLKAFEAVGADALHAPGVRDLATIKAVVSAVSKPVNVVMSHADTSITADDLAAAGVKRISVGGSIARYAMAAYHGGGGSESTVICFHPRATVKARNACFLLKTGEADMSSELGAPPRSGWARMVSELHVNDLSASLSFWMGIVGFDIAFQRPTERFAYLEHEEGHQIMLCQRHGRFETGPLTYPLGQGAMFQIYLQRLDPILSRLSARSWPIYLGPREIWRQVGDREHGQREIFVQDPDGYLLMLAEHLEIRPA